jgi:hypothetical protein
MTEETATTATEEGHGPDLLRTEMGVLFLGLAGIAFTLGARDVGLLLLIPGCFVGIAAALRKRRKRLPAPSRAVFTIPRSRRVKEALQALGRCEGGALVISGSSGVGKSLLAKAMAEELQRNEEITLIEERNYGMVWADEFAAKLQNLGVEEKTLFVLDQFEKIFMSSPKSLSAQMVMVRKLLLACRENPGWKCLLIVRREWFLNVLVFDEIRSALGDVVLLGGFDPQYEKAAYESFRRRLINLLGGDELLADAVIDDTRKVWRADLLYTLSSARAGELSHKSFQEQVVPVEAIAVVDALRYLRESRGRELSLAWYQKAGGLREAMRVFFDTYVQASEYPEEAARLLAALSVQPRARRALSDSELVWITNIPLTIVQRVIRFLEGARLLERVELRVDWVHDFFAERFNELSGNFIDPAERDNIVYFWEHLDDTPDPRAITELRENNRDSRLSFLLFGVSVLLLLARLLMYPIASRLKMGVPGWFWPGLLHPTGFLDLSFVDASFLPVAMSLAAWSWYTTSLYRRVLSRLKEGRAGRLGSLLTVVTSTLLVILSVLCPRLWIIFMGVGGLVVGLKYISVGARMGGRWRRPELFFGRVGLGTGANSIICIIGGIGYAWYLDNPGDDPLGIARFIAGVGAMSIMLVFAYIVSSLHIDQGRIMLILGIYRRYRQSSGAAVPEP